MAKKHKIEDVELHKGSYHQGDDLVYTADGKEVVVSGEFYVDDNYKLHHTHEFDDGTEIEIVIPYENGCYY